MNKVFSKKILISLGLIFGISLFIYFSLGVIEENLVYYWTPGELLEKADKVGNSTVRLGGMVTKGSVNWNSKTLKLHFSLGENPNSEGPIVNVISSGAPPQMFREGIGCVVEGQFDGKQFHSDRLIVKHSNEYQPPAENHDKNTLFKTLIEE